MIDFPQEILQRARDPWFNVSWAEPRPFDLEACVQLYVDALPSHARGASHRWRERPWWRPWLMVEDAIGEVEAQFWFEVATKASRFD